MNCDSCGAEFDASDIERDYGGDGLDVEDQCPECGYMSDGGE